LTGGDFEFDGKKYLQISGTAMGKIFAPSYANIYMAEWEINAIGRSPNKPCFWKRFLDDIFLLWKHGIDKFNKFLDILNSHHPSIKVVATIHEISVDFLDLTIFKGENFPTTGKLDTKVFFKKTDTHALLLKSSFHPKHIFSGILKSQVLRFHRLCSYKKDFDEACSKVFKILKQRGYSDRFLRKTKTLKELKIDFSRLGLSNEPVDLDESTWEQTDVPGSRKCEKNCKLCENLGVTRSVMSTNTRQEMAIVDRLDCQSKNIIYIMHCDSCKIQYIGETGYTMAARFRSHRHDISKQNDTPVPFHFNDVCAPHHMIAVPIVQCPELDTPEETTQNRREIEANLIKRFKTYIPYGLNKAVKGVKDVPAIPFIAPYSTLARNAATIVQKTYSKLQLEFTEHFPGRFVAAYSKNKNLKDILTSSQLKTLES
jgi:hypothetical protein